MYNFVTLYCLNQLFCLNATLKFLIFEIIAVSWILIKTEPFWCIIVRITVGTVADLWHKIVSLSLSASYRLCCCMVLWCGVDRQLGIWMVQFSSRWYLCAWESSYMCSTHLSGVSPVLPLKQFQCWSDWRWPFLILSRKIFERFLFLRLSKVNKVECIVLYCIVHLLCWHNHHGPVFAVRSRSPERVSRGGPNTTGEDAFCL